MITSSKYICNCRKYLNTINNLNRRYYITVYFSFKTAENRYCTTDLKPKHTASHFNGSQGFTDEALDNAHSEISKKNRNNSIHKSSCLAKQPTDSFIIKADLVPNIPNSDPCDGPNLSAGKTRLKQRCNRIGRKAQKCRVGEFGPPKAGYPRVLDVVMICSWSTVHGTADLTNLSLDR
jgi:hypothetical protein